MACFSKVPKPFGSISGATIPFISSQRRGSKPPSPAILVFFLNIKTMLKDQLFKKSRLKFDNWLFGPEKLWGLSRNRPQARYFDSGFLVRVNVPYRNLCNNHNRPISIYFKVRDWCRNSHTEERLRGIQREKYKRTLKGKPFAFDKSLGNLRVIYGSSQYFSVWAMNKYCTVAVCRNESKKRLDLNYCLFSVKS